jgi:D-hydroxyproline dehydrogenase subunit alpha
MMPRTVVVIGAGPAGLAAAEAALRAGAAVVLVDAEEQPGGQFHRMLPEAYAATHPQRLQHDWRAFDRRRTRVLHHPRCTWRPRTSVWALERQDGAPPRVHVLHGVADGTGRRPDTIDPDALILAPGAHDRVLPFPGWTLPGVYTAGAAQALAKGERVVVGDRVVVAGTGPFLLPVAGSLLEAGSRVLAVLEANRAATVARGWTTRGWELLPQAGKLLELAGYVAGQLRHRVPYRTGRTVIEARGDGRVEEVVTAGLRADWSIVPGSERTLAADAVCVGHGFSPRLELPVAAGCALRNDFVPVDEDQRTDQPGVFAAGEITGIAGALAAGDEGLVAGWIAAGGAPEAIRRERRRRDSGRAFTLRIAHAHPIGPQWTGWLRPDTVVCRCEDTEYASLCRALTDPATAGAHAVKLGTRAGLGPCQARICGPTIAELSTRAGGEVPAMHHRPIATPLRLGEIAAAADDDSA